MVGGAGRAVDIARHSDTQGRTSSCSPSSGPRTIRAKPSPGTSSTGKWAQTLASGAAGALGASAPSMPHASPSPVRVSPTAPPPDRIHSPDGRVYQVGDEGNMCGSVACDGGIQGACPGGETEGAFRKVICAPTKRRGPNAHLNKVTKKDETAGVWGGECVCPDGEVYLAGACPVTPTRHSALHSLPTVIRPSRVPGCGAQCCRAARRRRQPGWVRQLGVRGRHRAELQPLRVALEECPREVSPGDVSVPAPPWLAVPIPSSAQAASSAVSAVSAAPAATHATATHATASVAAATVAAVAPPTVATSVATTATAVTTIAISTAHAAAAAVATSCLMVGVGLSARNHARAHRQHRKRHARVSFSLGPRVVLSGGGLSGGGRFYPHRHLPSRGGGLSDASRAQDHGQHSGSKY